MIPEAARKYVYYEEPDSIVLLHGDCLEILPLLEPGSVDLVLTDPPYGIFKNPNAIKMFGKEVIYTQDTNTSKWDKRPSAEIFKYLVSLSDKRIVWGGNYLADMLGAWSGALVWNKKTGNNSYADGELAWSNVVGTMRIFNHQWCGAFKDSERGLRAMHPTQKPVELMLWCLSFVPDANLILDPFGGSGTTAIAAKQLGRKCIIIELEAKYLDITIERLRQEILC